MGTSLVTIADDDRGVRTLTLDRPAVHNAFDERLIAELTHALEAAEADDAVRIVVLAATGASFSAGADIGWMRRAGTYGEVENVAEAEALAKLLSTLDQLAKPTVARVNGAALGGAVGLVCACDVAIAADEAVFGTTEVRLGIVPAVIGLFVVRAVGARAARRLFLTGERISAARAQSLGLVHDVVPAAALDGAVATVVDDLRKGAPGALTEAKRLVETLANDPADDARLDEATHLIARVRAGAEAREGLSAFLEKRPPDWT
ncbi:MAG: enoyl-CoA hydratase-related protein [Pseudomonadota bacterium]